VAIILDVLVANILNVLLANILGVLLANIVDVLVANILHVLVAIILDVLVANTLVVLVANILDPKLQSTKCISTCRHCNSLMLVLFQFALKLNLMPVITCTEFDSVSMAKIPSCLNTWHQIFTNYYFYNDGRSMCPAK